MGVLTDGVVARQRDTAFRLRGVSAVYRHTEEEFDHKTGSITRTNTDTKICVLRGPVSSSQSTDRTFRTKLCTLPPNRPRNGDRIVFENVEYIITSWITDQSEIVVDLRCRRP